MLVKIFILLFITLNFGCGPNSNPLGRAMPASDLEAFDVQLSLSQAYLDLNDNERARIHAEKALKINPNSEDAAVLLGYVYLNLLGLSAFDIAAKFNKKTETASSSDQTDPFLPMKNLLGITQTDLLQIGTLNTDFPSYPIIEPKCALKARASIETLGISTEGIKAICPFVDQEVLIKSDSRHQCESTTGQRIKPVQSHFLWLMLHLYEGFFFNSVINYKTASKEKTNLELRALSVATAKPTTIEQLNHFILDIDSVSLSVASVLDLKGETCPSENPQTMLLALVNDLLTASLTTARMPGIPENIKVKFDKMASIISNVQSSKAADALNQAANLRRSLAKNMATSLSDTINKLDVTSLSTKDKKNLCASFNKISQGKTADLPKLCQ